MKLPSLFRSAGLVLLFAAAGAAVSAQQTVKCESNNGGRNYCGSFPPDRVTMNQQISGSPCIRGNSWGVDNRGLWVDRGCRAIFMIGRGLLIGALESSLASLASIMSVRPTRSYSAQIVLSQ